MERWKVLDNLRRSLIAPGLVLWLVLSWTVLPLPLGLSSGLAIIVPAMPLLLQIFGMLFHVVKDRSLAGLRDFARNGWVTAAQVLMNASVMLYQAYLSVDAIVPHPGPVVGDTAANAGMGDGGVGGSPTRSGPGCVLADHVSGDDAVARLRRGRLLTRPASIGAAAGFLLAWMLSPVVAWWTSQERQVREKPLSELERRELGLIARKTWGFFESFVCAEDHWLPPDNFQEEPRHQLAHRTSPTNQGLLLVATLAAEDFGFVNLDFMLERLEKTFDTLDQLERHRGHFYNWYDTRSLAPLQPTYISTVDSGNLAGSLLTLKQGLLEKQREPVPSFRAERPDRYAPRGEGAMGQLGCAATTPRPAARLELEHGLKELEAALAATPSELPAWLKWL